MPDPVHDDDLVRKEELLRMKPDYQKYIELADAYQQKGRHKDAARMIEQAEELLESTKRRISLKRETYFLSGALNLDILTEIMQMLHRMQSSGELILEMPRFTSHIFFKGGEVIHVDNGEFSSQEGIENFNDVLKECEGFYHFVVRDVERVPRTINMDCRHLILEAFRQMDEMKAEDSGESKEPAT